MTESASSPRNVRNLPALLAHPLLQAVVIVILGAAAYSNSFDVPLQYDDFTALRKTIDNRFRFGLDGGIRWVTDLTFSFNRLVHGEQVAGYHLVNLLIHLIAPLFLLGIFRSALTALKLTLTGQDSRSVGFLSTFIPFTAAALFVCHPVHTQAVTYIAQRYTSLATLFYLASMFFFIKARQTLQSSDRSAAFPWWVATMTCALLAMMSKEIAFTLPAMLMLLELMLFNGRLFRKPLFVVAMLALFAVIPLQLAYIHASGSGGSLTQGLQQASAEAQSISRGDYLLTQIRVIATYLRLMVLPVNLNLDYDFPLYRSLADGAVLLSLILHAVLLGTAFWLYRLSNRPEPWGESGCRICLRLASLGICWFYLGLLVESSVIPIRDVINEHRLYLPSGGFLLTVSSLAGGLACRRAPLRALAWGITAICCLIFTTASFKRNRVWHDELTMWQDVLTKSPNKPRARFNAGFQLAKHSRHAEALPHLVRALELDPTSILYWITLNGTVSMLEAASGRSSSGIQYQAMIDTVKSEHMTPWKAISYNNLGLAYEFLGNLPAAQAHYILAVSSNPSLDLAWLNLALVSARQGNRTGFEAARSQLARINPVRAASLTYSGVPQ